MHSVTTENDEIFFMDIEIGAIKERFSIRASGLQIDYV